MSMSLHYSQESLPRKQGSEYYEHVMNLWCFVSNVH